MKKRMFSIVLSVVMAVACLGGLAGCGGSAPISNEETRLVIATQELDGVFNPFFSSSATDSNIVGMTQLGMLVSDPQGTPAYGADEACAVLDYEQRLLPNELNPEFTEYLFVLKNDLKFSNGSPLTMKDVLFNLYVYLDPMYTGSATVYSTDIVGLKKYRTGQDSDTQADNFEDTYRQLGADRIRDLSDQFELIYEDHKDDDKRIDDADMLEYLREREEIENNDNFRKDYEAAKKQLKVTFDSTWNASVGTAKDIKNYKEDKTEVTLNTDAEAFFYNWGIISWDDEHDEYDYGWAESLRNSTKEQVLSAVEYNYVPNSMIDVLYGYCYEELLTQFIAAEKEDFFKEHPESVVNNISGITFANRGQSVTVNGKTYGAISTDKTSSAYGYDESGALKDKENNEVLRIIINKVDPKAIWNFSVTVAPMYYYSNAEQIAKFDYENNFGVLSRNNDFMNNVVNSTDKIGLPVGAGPYKATTRTGDSEHVTAADFKSNNVVYFERNDHFMFPAKIKYVNYQVVTTQQTLSSLFSGAVHYAEPGAKQEYIDEIIRHSSEGFASTETETNGYGYIGINASKVPDINVRKAIMHAIDTSETVGYYASHAKAINRAMSRANWAYPILDKTNHPEDVDCEYYVTDSVQMYEYDKTGAKSKELLKGYTATNKKNSNGKNVLQDKFGNLLKYTFTIAGESMDHPAFNALFNAAQILNEIGFDIEVKPDIRALNKLATGDLAVWAAAWSSTIDPDLYQVYHKDSTAGATKNWGYNTILSQKSKYPEENNIIEELSELIEQGRETLVQYGENGRKHIYAEALAKIMELAVELPCYQRNDLFAYNSKIINESTLVLKASDGLSPFNGPLSRMWEISFNETT